MTVDYSLQPMDAPRPRRRWLEFILIVGFLVCLVIGVAALVSLWVFSQSQEVTLNNSPFALLQPERISPGLAVRQLAGDPSAPLIMQATQAGELATAAALLLYETETAGSKRANLWRQLAQRLGEDDSAAAALALKQLFNLGILDVALHSLERSQVLIQSAEGFAASGDMAAALSAATQALRVITQSPDLLPAQRSQLLMQLKPVADRVDDPELQARLDDFLRNPFVKAEGLLLTDSLSALVAPPPYDPSAAEAAALRRQAARNLADRYVLTSGIDVEPERQALAGALLAEDQTRSAFYRTLLESPISLQQQLAIFQEQRRWTLLKLQVAQRAFGISLQPEWEANQAALLGELDRLMANIAAAGAALADAQSTPLEQTILRAETNYAVALQSTLGLYPGANNGEIGERLRIIQNELEQQGTRLALPIAYDSAAYPAGFRIQQRP